MIEEGYYVASSGIFSVDSEGVVRVCVGKVNVNLSKESENPFNPTEEELELLSLHRGMPELSSALRRLREDIVNSNYYEVSPHLFAIYKTLSSAGAFNYSGAGDNEHRS